METELRELSLGLRDHPPLFSVRNAMRSGMPQEVSFDQGAGI